MHVWQKMSTYAHARDATHVIHDQETYQKWIEGGVHIDGQTQLIPRPPEVPLPAPVEVLRRLNLGKFPETAPLP